MERISAKIKGKNLINNQWMEGVVNFCDFNPATGFMIAAFPRSTAKDVKDAVEAAKNAYPAWKKVPAPKRGEILFRTAEMLRKRKEELAIFMTEEMGKNLTETRGDVQEAIDMCEFVAGEGRRFYGVTTPSELPNKFAMSKRMPIGVCGLITPWNFPVAIPSWKIAPALICGNTIVFKPAEDTPGCGQLFVEILFEAGLYEYPGVINLVHGNGEETGAPLVAHKDINLISFTGSSKTGKIVAIQCANDYKKVSLEMGGKNCTITMDDADLELATNSSWWGAFGTTGQRCTASSRLIVHRSVVEKFTKLLVAKALQTKVGNGLDPDVEVGPLINKRALQKVKRYIKIAEREGAKILCGGETLYGNKYENGNFFQPTVLWAPNPKMRVNQEEIFGPVTSIIPASDLDEAIKIANCVNFGLSAAIITSDINNAFRSAMEDLESGIVYVNSSTIGAEVHLPFGGVKRTGNGHREGLGALDIFSEWKTIYIDYSGKLQKAQIDN